jgi:hypothetical protein
MLAKPQAASWIVAANNLSRQYHGQSRGFAMNYEPKPIDTSAIELSDELRELTEELARSTHDIWARGRLAEGWTYGEKRDDAQKQHPGLVPYEELTEAEKDYDRRTAMETLKAVMALGYDVVKRGKPPRARQ